MSLQSEYDAAREDEVHKLRQQLATVTEQRDRLLAALRVNGLACKTCGGTGNNIKPGFQCFDCNGSGLNDEAKSYDREDIAESRGSEHHE